MLQFRQPGDVLGDLQQAMRLLNGDWQRGKPCRAADIAAALRRDPDLRDDLDALLDRIAAISDTPVEIRRAPSPRKVTPNLALTKRQKEILHWVALGKSNSTIACILGISIHTVDTHLRRIFLRLGTTDRTVTALKAVQQGLIPAAA